MYCVRIRLWHVHIHLYIHTCVQKHPCNAAIQCSETSPGKCFWFFQRTFWVDLGEGAVDNWPSQAIEWWANFPQGSLLGKTGVMEALTSQWYRGNTAHYSNAAYYSCNKNVGEPMINWWWSFVVCAVEPKLCMSLQWNPFHKTFRCRILLNLQHQDT